jgi:hypothetical protein
MTLRCESSPAEKAVREPFQILDAFYIVVFLFAVVHVCWNERRIDWLFLFLVPPLWALAVNRSPKSRWSTKLPASFFVAAPFKSQKSPDRDIFSLHPGIRLFTIPS